MAPTKCFVCSSPCKKDARRHTPSEYVTYESWEIHPFLNVPMHSNCRPRPQSSTFKPAKPKSMNLPTYRRFLAWERRSLQNSTHNMTVRIEYEDGTITTTPTTDQKLLAAKTRKLS